MSNKKIFLSTFELISKQANALNSKDVTYWWRQGVKVAGTLKEFLLKEIPEEWQWLAHKLVIRKKGHKTFLLSSRPWLGSPVDLKVQIILHKKTLCGA